MNACQICQKYLTYQHVLWLYTDKQFMTNYISFTDHTIQLSVAPSLEQTPSDKSPYRCNTNFSAIQTAASPLEAASILRGSNLATTPKSTFSQGKFVFYFGKSFIINFVYREQLSIWIISFIISTSNNTIVLLHKGATERFQKRIIGGSNQRN